MQSISANIRSIKEQIPPSVKLVAVSKTRSVEEILVAYNSGQKIFGENRVQELLQKKDLLPRDIEWHLIGHLQSNKVRLVVPFISMIQSVDSFKLLKTIDAEASRVNRIISCLLQIHIAEEETKFGFSMAELNEMMMSHDFSKLNSVRICGVMGMATFTDNNEIIRKEFRYLHRCFDELKGKYFMNNSEFEEISMGMSGDFLIAAEEGSTMIRIGSLIFGERNKTN
jgi:pyridoxal phosphate enzyme (YggS family)